MKIPMLIKYGIGAWKKPLLVVYIKKAAPTNTSTMTCATIPSFHKDSANFRASNHYSTAFYSVRIPLLL